MPRITPRHGRFRSAVAGALRRAADRLLPQSCAFCGSAGAPVCSPCSADLPWLDHACERCGLPLETALPRGVACGECQRRPPPYDTTFAPFAYEFPVDAAIKSLKFRRQLYLVPALATLVLPWLDRRVSCYDALVPVPLHRLRHAARGFNQAGELAAWLGRRTGLRVADGVRRRLRTRPQSTLAAAERRRNVRGAFELVGPLPGARVLLVDDVITTGETCRELARLLRARGAGEIGVLAIARAAIGR